LDVDVACLAHGEDLADLGVAVDPGGQQPAQLPHAVDVLGVLLDLGEGGLSLRWPVVLRRTAISWVMPAQVGLPALPPTASRALVASRVAAVTASDSIGPSQVSWP
jgi:hypothetical protein